MRISDWSSDVCSSDLPDELPDCSTPHQKPRIVDEPTSLRNKQPGTGFSRGQPLQCLGATNLCLEIGDDMRFATGGESWDRVVPVFALPYAIWTLYVHLIVAAHARSEEHTSDLQSLMSISYAALCLKNKIIIIQYSTCNYYLSHTRHT